VKQVAQMPGPVQKARGRRRLKEWQQLDAQKLDATDGSLFKTIFYPVRGRIYNFPDWEQPILCIFIFRLHAKHSLTDSSPTNLTERTTMRMLMNVKLPHATFNAAVKDGTAATKVNKILEAIKPEAVYFTEQNGLRSAILIVNLQDPSKVPSLSEPWFLTFQADVEFRIVMSPDDLKHSGIGDIGKTW
jgi:hypothetical protein